MITRVLDTNGEVLHDCIQSGCTVSWDGFALRDLAAEEVYPDEKSRPAIAAGVGVGKQVPGASAVDIERWTIRDRTAILRERQD